MRTVLTAILGSGIEIGLGGSAPFRLIPIRLMRTKLLLTDVFNAPHSEK